MDYTTWKNTIFNKMNFHEKLKLYNEYLDRSQDSHIYTFDEENVNKCFDTPYHLAMSLTIVRKTDEFFIIDSEGEGVTLSVANVTSLLTESEMEIYLSTFNNVRVLGISRANYDQWFLDDKTQKELSEIALADKDSCIWGSLEKFSKDVNCENSQIYEKYFIYFIDF